MAYEHLCQESVYCTDQQQLKAGQIISQRDDGPVLYAQLAAWQRVAGSDDSRDLT